MAATSFAESVASNIGRVDMMLAGGYQPPQDLADHIQRKWAAFEAESGGTLHNGPALGVREFGFSHRSNILSLTVEKGTYRDYRFSSLDEECRAVFPDDLWFSALCIGALVVTDEGEDKDGFFCFGQRPLDAIQSPGRIDMPMGHPARPEEYRPADLAGYKVWQELGLDVEFLELSPLGLTREEPARAYNLAYYAKIGMSKEELEAREEEQEETHHKGRFFFPATVEGVEELLRRAWKTKETGGLEFSPPVLRTLMEYGRKMFGLAWYKNALPMLSG